MCDFLANGTNAQIGQQRYPTAPRYPYPQPPNCPRPPHPNTYPYPYPYPYYGPNYPTYPDPDLTKIEQNILKEKNGEDSLKKFKEKLSAWEGNLPGTYESDVTGSVNNMPRAIQDEVRQFISDLKNYKEAIKEIDTNTFPDFSKVESLKSKIKSETKKKMINDAIKAKKAPQNKPYGNLNINNKVNESWSAYLG